MRAADMFERNVSPAEIARQVGVSHQIVSDWRAAQESAHERTPGIRLARTWLHSTSRRPYSRTRGL